MAGRGTQASQHARTTAAIAFGVALLVHAPGLLNGLTNWDDNRYISGSAIAEGGVRGVGIAFTHTFDAAYFPLTHSAYALIHAIAGETPWPYHALSLLLFAIAVAMLPAVLRSAGVRPELTLFASLLFAVHPLRVENVAWAANLKDVLSLFFVVLSARVLPRSTLAALLAFIAALLSKSTVAMLAPLLIWLQLRLHPAQPRWRAALYGAPALLALLVAAQLQLSAGGRTLPGGSLTSAVPSMLWLPWEHTARMLWPSPLHALYGFTPVSYTDLRLFAALALWLALLALLLSRRGTQRQPARLLTALWALPFAPYTGVAPLATYGADRYALYPSLALCLLAAWGLSAALRTNARTTAAVALLCTALALLTVQRTRDWRSSLSLWLADSTVRSVDAQVNLAGALGGAGRWAEASAALERARGLAPQRLDLLSHLVFARLAEAGAPEPAIDAAVATVDRSGRDPKILRALADAAQQQGYLQAAHAICEALRSWDPLNPAACPSRMADAAPIAPP